MQKRILVDLGKYVVGFGLLGYVVWRNWEPSPGSGLSAVWQRHVVDGKPVHWGFFAAAVCVCTFSVLLTFIRWYILVRAQELPFTPAAALRLGLVGYFFNTFLPGSVGGDLVKAVAIARQQSRRTVAVATVLIDRVVGLWGLFWLVMILGCVFWSAGYLQGPSQQVCQRIILASAALVAVSSIAWGVMGFVPHWRAQRFSLQLERLPRVGNSVAEAWRALWMYRLKAGSVGLAVLLSIIGHIGFVSGYYFAARTLQSADEIPNVTTHFLIVPIGMAVQAGVPLPGGVGAGEWIQGSLYALVGFPAANGVLMSLVNRVITWLLGLIGYIVYLQTRPRLQDSADPLESDDPDLLSLVPVSPDTTATQHAGAPHVLRN